MQTTDVGIIGCGAMGRIHTEALAAIPSCRVIGFVNRTRSRAEELSREFGGTIYPTVKAMLAEEAIDAVVIASSQQLHARQIIASLEAGKDVFCEKPLALTSRELAEIEKIAIRSDCIVMVGHQLRYHPVIEAVRDALPRLGGAFHLDLEMAFKIASHEGRCWKEIRSGGFFMELGCHLVDLARGLLGEIHHVSGSTLRLNPKRATEDFAQSLLSFESGATASLITSANHRTLRQGLLRGRILGREGRIDFSIYPYGRELNSATLAIDDGEDLFVAGEKTTNLLGRLPASPTEPYPGFFDVYQRQAREFISSVQSRREPAVTLHDGRLAVEGVLATYHSQGTKTRNKRFFPPRRTHRIDSSCHPLVKA